MVAVAQARAVLPAKEVVARFEGFEHGGREQAAFASGFFGIMRFRSESLVMHELPKRYRDDAPGSRAPHELSQHCDAELEARHMVHETEAAGKGTSGKLIQWGLLGAARCRVEQRAKDVDVVVDDARRQGRSRSQRAAVVDRMEFEARFWQFLGKEPFEPHVSAGKVEHLEGLTRREGACACRHVCHDAPPPVPRCLARGRKARGIIAVEAGVQIYELSGDRDVHVLLH